MVLIQILSLLLTIINTFILITFLALASKLLKPKEEPVKKSELVDLAMNNSSYGDQRVTKPLSTDIVLLRDE